LAVNLVHGFLPDRDQGAIDKAEQGEKGERQGERSERRVRPGGGKQAHPATQQQGDAGLLGRAPGAVSVHQLMRQKVKRHEDEQQQAGAEFAPGKVQRRRGQIRGEDRRPDRRDWPAAFLIKLVALGANLSRREPPALEPAVRRVGEPNGGAEHKDPRRARAGAGHPAQLPLPKHHHRRRIERQHRRPLPPTRMLPKESHQVRKDGTGREESGIRGGTACPQAVCLRRWTAL